MILGTNGAVPCRLGRTLRLAKASEPGRNAIEEVATRAARTLDKQPRVRPIASKRPLANAVSRSRFGASASVKWPRLDGAGDDARGSLLGVAELAGFVDLIVPKAKVRRGRDFLGGVKKVVSLAALCDLTPLVPSHRMRSRRIGTNFDGSGARDARW